MAERKPLFMSSAGFAEEMAQADTATFGGLTLLGPIDMNDYKILQLGPATSGGDALSYGQSGAVLSGLDVAGNKITNLAPGTAATDAVNYEQLQDSITGLDVKQSVRATTTADLGATYNPTGGAGGTGQFTGAPTTTDGVSLVAGDRVLVKDQTDPKENGIYVVTATTTTWDRASDFDEDAEVTADAFTFVAEGTIWADTGWVLITDDVITLNTSNLVWAQFSSAGVITAGDGLYQTGNAFHVNPGFGIEVSSDKVNVYLDTDPGLEFAAASGLRVKDGQGIIVTASGVEVDLYTTPGLEFIGGSPNGQLAVLASPLGGLQVTVSGVEVKLDETPNTLDVDADGLKVVGLPLNFYINDIATGSTVTAANLDTLTNGSNADALHTHASATATEAPKVENDIMVNEAILAGDPVHWSTVADRIAKSDAGVDAKSFVMGVARLAQAVVGSTTPVVSLGEVESVLTALVPTIGQNIYLADGGGLALTAPGAGKRVIRVGMAMNTDDLWVSILDYGKKAA